MEGEKIFENFKLTIDNHVANVNINRPEKANALVEKAWEEMKEIFEHCNENSDIRVVILRGEGKHFCAGIDMETLMNLSRFAEIEGEGRKREKLRAFILKLQDTVSSMEKCRKPVIAAIHGACVGGAVDIVTACDMRFCSEDAYFSIKEIDLGLVADVGTLQRLPTIISPGMVAEMAYTGRRVYGPEAEKIHLVNSCTDNKEAMVEKVNELAAMIASKSPLSIRGTKEMLLYKRDHSVNDSLNYMASWNASMLLSNDLMEAFQAFMEKRSPKFEN